MRSNAALADLGDRRFVFCANPGRSGSGFLANLLDGSDGIDAGHERDPALTGPWVRRVAYRGPAESRSERLVKLDAIAAECRALEGETIYADTSHLFLMVLSDLVAEHLDHDRVTVIVLRRDPVQVARSFFRLGTLGPNARAWHGWHAPPTADAMRFRLRRDQVSDQFDLIFGNLVDSVARTDRLRALAPGFSWIDVWLHDLVDDGGVDLFRRLDVDPPPSDAGPAQQPVNRKEREKASLGLDIDEGVVAERLRDFIARWGSTPEVSAFVDHYRISDR